MSAGRKLLIEFAAISITLILIGLGIAIATRSQALSDTVLRSQDNQLQAEQEHAVVKYDGIPINGSLAVNYVKEVVSEYDIPVAIKKSGTIVRITSSEQFSELRDVDSTSYLHPFKEYECAVLRDVNDVIVEVQLEQLP